MHTSTARRRVWPMAEKWTCDRGSVTAEFAVAAPAVALVLAMCVGAVVSAANQVAVQDIAGEAARLAARGDAPEIALSQRAQHDTSLEVWDAGELRCARASVPVRLLGADTGTVATATSCALRDVEVGD